MEEDKRRGSNGCGGDGVEPSQIVQKSWNRLLTLWEAPDYIRLTNEGGAPLASKKFASTTVVSEEIQESRVSDTRLGPKPKADRPMTPFLRCPFFEN